MNLAIIVATLLLALTPAQATDCLDPDAREKVRTLMLEGIDAGFRQHVVHVFDNWLKDSSDQPARAIKGMRIGINAYARSRAVALKWLPPICKGDL